MSRRTDDEIRDLIERVTVDAPSPHAWSEVVYRSTGSDDADRGARRRQRSVWLAAAACLIAGVGGVVVLVDNGDDGIRIDEAPATSGPPLTEPTPETTDVPEADPSPDTTSGPSPSATVDPEESQPRVNPLRSGQSLETVVGDIVWTEILGSAENLPEVVASDGDGGFVGQSEDGQVWRSFDGIEWEETDTEAMADAQDIRFGDGGFEPIEHPVGAASFTDYVALGGDVLALSTTAADDGPEFELWISTDTRTWEPVELPATSGVSTREAQLRTLGSRALLTLYSGSDSNLSDRQHETFSTTDGRNWEPIQSPSASGAEISYVEVGDSLLALCLCRFDADGGWELELWTGEDLRTWETVALPSPSGERTDATSLQSDGSRALLTIYSSDAGNLSGQGHETWSTTDGRTWEPVEALSELPAGNPQPTDFGWVSEDGDAKILALSPDGLDWQEISYTDIGRRPPGGTTAHLTSIDRTIFVISTVSSSRFMLVGHIVDD